MLLLRDKEKPGYQPGILKKKDLTSMIQAPSSATALVSAVEEFVASAEAFLQNHYMVGSDSEDISKILKAFHNLNLDINVEQLEQEFDIHLEKKTQMADHYDSAWF